jgi:L-alanine-DL-glutamate epimerase-like enolase superfamily enzyme
MTGYANWCNRTRKVLGKLMGLSQPTIDEADISIYTIPTDAPEADGTFQWNSTMLVLAELKGAGAFGLGYTYGSQAVAVIARHLAEKCVIGQTVCSLPHIHQSMRAQVRNNGNQGVTAMAISALDIALWDLKAKHLNCPVSELIGIFENSVAAYGSGGFTSYSNAQLTRQLAGWAEGGFSSVKMKIGSNPASDPERVSAARKAIGPDVALFVDANGAYDAKQAVALARRFAENGVSWFEEPVSSDNLEGLKEVRLAVPYGIEVAAGEYGYDPCYFRRMLESHAVDVLQIDATRAMGFTGFLSAASVAASFGIPVSAHCAPSLHMHVGCAVPGFRHVEYFHDHARIEEMLFDGFIPARNGRLEPDRSRPGLGLIFKREDASRLAA